MIILSVIIPTRNRSQLLDKTLASIRLQSVPDDVFEVVVVDNNSTDDTPAIAEKYSKRFDHFVYVKEVKPGLHEGRHAGLRVARGRILIYIDDDIEAVPEWLAAIDDSFKDGKVGLVGGKAIPSFESDPPPWLGTLWEQIPDGKVLPFLSLVDLGDEVKQVDPGLIFGCNFSVRKDLLIKIGGFHPDGMPESLLRFRGDGETFVASEIKNLGYKCLYHPKASIQHWVPAGRMTHDYIKKRLFMFGIARSFTVARSSNAQIQGLTLVDKLKRYRRLLMSKGMAKELLKSFYQGYDYHQSELVKDQELRAWVLKDNYLPEDLRALR